MPLVNLRDVLKDAKEKKYAIGAFNAINLEMVRGIIEAAEQVNSPVILSHAEPHFKFTPLEMMIPIMLNAAKYAKVPVVVHLDHGKSFAAIVKAINLGCTSIMYDGSMLPLDQNIENAREIVKMTRVLGISVEAELGHVARPEGGGAEDENDESAEDASLHTKPGEALQFIESTGIDALAVAFGTAHGIYLSEPVLDFARLEEINSIAGIPLVMHGGSGLSPDDFRKSIEHGITKINYYTNLACKVARDLKENLDSDNPVFYHDIIGWSIESIKKDVIETMKVFNSIGKA